LLPAIVVCLPFILYLSRDVVLKPGFHVVVLIFLITAAIGSWTSYNSSMAGDKFWILLGAVFVFYAAVYQPFKNLPVVFLILGVIGSLFAVYFSLTYDWRTNPVDTAVVNQIGARWMDFRPNFQFRALLDDIAGGIFAFLLPLIGALFICGIQTKANRITLMSAAAVVLISMGLLLSGLRAAWGALAAGMVLTLLLIILQPKLLHYSKNTFRYITAASLLLFVIGGVLLFGSYQVIFFPDCKRIHSSVPYVLVSVYFEMELTWLAMFSCWVEG
jgi:hypothetical protein